MCGSMSEQTIAENVLAAVAAHLRSRPFVSAAYLLGSAAEGRLRPDSDVDIAVLPRPGQSLAVQERLALAAELASIVGRHVDLGSLSLANLVYAKEAVAGGRLVFERDHLVTAQFEMYTLSMYASLQEARREVLHAYAA